MSSTNSSHEGATWAWADSIDAVVAVPAHHTVLLENQQVRVLDTRIAPGDTVPLHTHRWPSVLHVLSWSDFVRHDERGTVIVDTRAIPGVYIRMAHDVFNSTTAVENAGGRDSWRAADRIQLGSRRRSPFQNHIFMKIRVAGSIFAAHSRTKNQRLI